MMDTHKSIIPEPFLSRSQSLRSNQTPWEAKLWHYIRAKRFYGLNFKRQVQIGIYIVDFSCREKMVIVELDGGGHSQTTVYDQTKDAYLIKQGYKVLRVWNTDIDHNFTGVLENLKEICGM